MSQSTALISTLKQQLKSYRLTYADIAKSLSMSEANVKRLFATKRFTLERLEEICELMNMQLIDLVQIHEDSLKTITHFTQEQEQELVKDKKFLLVAVAVRNKFTFKNLIEEYDLSETECTSYLAKLDRLKIIDLLPGNKIKLRITEEFRWLPNGPIECFFEKQIQPKFLNSNFIKESEQRLFMFGMFSESSMEIIKNKIQAIEKEFAELQRADSVLPISKRQAFCCLLAFRPWQADIFKPYLRKNNNPAY